MDAAQSCRENAIYEKYIHAVLALPALTILRDFSTVRRMKRFACLCVCVCLLVRLTLLPARVCWGADASPNPSLIVLRDGGVLTGDVSRNETGYVVHHGGTEIQVPAAKVLIACRSLEEAYAAQRREIKQPSAAAHLALATWCLSYGLKAQAAEELAAARKLEPTHPRLALLQRRLAATTTTTSSRSLPETSALSPLAAAAGPPAAEPVMQIDDLTPAVVERFTRKVQPILVNNCTASGCHLRGGPQQFQLDRALLHGLANRRTTLYNLSATLALVDREQPQLSPLLVVPRQTHGGMRAPIFGPRHAAAFNHLVAWVALVTRRDSSESEPLPPGDTHADKNLTSNLQRPTVLQNDVSPESAVSSPVQASQALPQRSPIQYGARLKPWRPKDEFDPDIFNRQQRKLKQAEVSAVAGQAPAEDEEY
jgi:hypothetical protein